MRKQTNQSNGDPAPLAGWGPRGTAGAAIPASLAYESVERRYGQLWALRGVSIKIETSQILCLLGPSGCGKTTLLRIAAGIEKPSAGRVLLNDLEVAGPNRFVPPERRSVGLMFQDYALFPHLSIIDNVAFGLHSLGKAEAQRQALAALGRVGLARYASQYPHILSGGEQQRVALARAIAPRPAMLLMDEPFSGLDVQLRDSMQDETLTLLRETRMTAVIVTHHPEEAMRLADRIAVMRAGKVVQHGTAQELYLAPKDLFVARLFSEINEIPSIVKDQRVETSLGSFPALGLTDETKAILCVRQRGIRLRPPGEGVPGRVVDVRFMGDAARIEVAVQGLETPLRVRSEPGQQIAKGEEVSVKVDARETLVFLADGEDRQ